MKIIILNYNLSTNKKEYVEQISEKKWSLMVPEQEALAQEVPVESIQRPDNKAV